MSASVGGEVNYWDGGERVDLEEELMSFSFDLLWGVDEILWGDIRYRMGGNEIILGDGVE